MICQYHCMDLSVQWYGFVYVEWICLYGLYGPAPIRLPLS
jgi:hypothetical protein